MSCFILFKAEWCRNCIQFGKEYNKAVSCLEKDNVQFDSLIYEYTNKDHTKFFKEYNVQTVPTMLYRTAGTKAFVEYEGDQSEIYTFMQSTIKDKPLAEELELKISKRTKGCIYRTRRNKFWS